MLIYTHTARTLVHKIYEIFSSRVSIVNHEIALNYNSMVHNIGSEPTHTYRKSDLNEINSRLKYSLCV